MKQKPKTKLVHIGWVNTYEATNKIDQFGGVWETKEMAIKHKQFDYIDTVRVFAEVPVTPRKAAAMRRKRGAK